MSIRKQIAAVESHLHGGACEGVRLALVVLDNCKCGTCFYYSDQIVECSHPFGMRNPTSQDHCSRWEPKTGWVAPTISGGEISPVVEGR